MSKDKEEMEKAIDRTTAKTNYRKLAKDNNPSPLEALEIIKHKLCYQLEDNAINKTMSKVDNIKQALIKGSESEKENARLKDAISALVDKYGMIKYKKVIKGEDKELVSQIFNDLKLITEVE